MEKQFVPYELAVKLKKLGFDEPCIMCYRNKTIYGSNIAHGYQDNWFFKSNTDHDGNLVNKETPFYWISAPLWQQAFDWFRENHNIIIQPLSVWETEEEIDYIKNKPTGYIMDLFLYDSDFTQNTATIYKTYEKARLACLEKSIELLKEIGN